MRRASEVTDTRFPYADQHVCWVLVADDGTVTSPQGYQQRQQAAAQLAAGQGRLFIAWPGQRETHLFEVDDLDRLALALTPRPPCVTCGRPLYLMAYHLDGPDGTTGHLVVDRWAHLTGGRQPGHPALPADPAAAYRWAVASHE